MKVSDQYVNEVEFEYKSAFKVFVIDVSLLCVKDFEKMAKTIASTHVLPTQSSIDQGASFTLRPNSTFA